MAIAAPSANSIGSYILGYIGSASAGQSWTFGNNYSAGNNSLQSGSPTIGLGNLTQGPISGTWKWLGNSGNSGCGGQNTTTGLAVRVS